MSTSSARPLVSPAAESPKRGARSRSRRWLRLIAIIAVLAILAAGLVRGFIIQPFTVPTASMAPTIHAGQTVNVWRPDGLGAHIDRGDVVVIDGRGSFIPGKPADQVQKIGSWFGIGPRNVFFAKRVVAVAGDQLSCCDAQGYLELNGARLEEPYLAIPVGAKAAGDAGAQRASAADFDVEVPPGRVFLLGDNRDNSTDSRDLLGKPGGGMIRESEVLGVVIGHGSRVD